VPRAPVGSLHPHLWAWLFRQDPSLLRRLLPQLRRGLQWIFSDNHWEDMHSLALSRLHLFGPDEESLAQRLWRVLGSYTGSFVLWLIKAVVTQCSGEAQRRLGVGVARAPKERESSPAVAPVLTASRGGSPALGAAPPEALMGRRQKSSPAPH